MTSTFNTGETVRVQLPEAVRPSCFESQAMMNTKLISGSRAAPKRSAMRVYTLVALNSIIESLRGRFAY